MDELVIEVERRSSAGKSANRKLRQTGLIPAVVYGGGKESVPVVIDRHSVTELLRQEQGRNTLFLLKMKGTKQERHAMLRDAQIDPRTRQFIHLDFIRVMKGQHVKVEVPVVLEGEAIGVKTGGFLDWTSRSLHIECAAEIIPHAFRVNITHLGLAEHVTAGDVEMPEGVKLLDDPHRVIVTIEVHGAKAGEEEEKPETAPAESAEPEVIKRGKVSEAGGE
ncbi:MAG: 50S ribosomal protein L25 [Acidobacteriota bacterium]